MSTSKYRLRPSGFSLHWPTKLPIKKSLIVIVAGVWLVCGIVVYAQLAKRSVARTRSYNAAILLSLSSDISSLPAVSTIDPAHTSQNMAYVAESRRILSTDIGKGKFDAQRVSLLYRLFPSANTASQETKQRDITHKLGGNLKANADQLKTLQKFVEYMPMVDFADKLDDSPTRSDHLTRTRDGLTKTATYLKSSSLPDHTELARAIYQLAAEVPSLSDSTKSAWSQKVFVQQEAVLKSLALHDIQSGDYSASLSNLATSYQ